MINNKDITIIIPAYNEEEGIVDVINNIKKLHEKYEIFVIDDGSTDNTYELAINSGVKVIRHSYNKGYGAALKTGIRNSTTDFVLLLDADGQHKPDDIKNFIPYIDEFDMVVGMRTGKSKVSLLRRPGKKFLSLTANYLAGTQIPDLNSGFRAIKKEMALEFMHFLPNTFSFTTTITLACIKSGYNIKYIPIDAPKRVGKSKIKPFRDGSRFILLIIRTIVLFDPLKVFLPVSVILFIIGFIELIREIICYFDIWTTPVLLILSAIVIFFFGIIADQISSIRRAVK